MALVDNAWYVDFGNGSSTGYYGVPIWATGVSKVCGNIIRQATTPAVGSERTFICISSTGGTGTTGGAEPTWVVTRGAKNPDNTLVWMEATGTAAINGDLTNTPTWATIKGTNVTQGQVIQNVAGTLILIATTGGTAGSGVEPSWSAFTNAGATTADNSVTWTTLGSSFSAWASPHARLANAVATTWGQVNNSFFIGDDHNETSGAAISIAFPGAQNTPNFAYCVDHTVAPPGSSNLKTTAKVSTTATGASGNMVISGSVYIYGITFIANGTSIKACNAVVASWQVFDTCSLQLSGAASSLIELTPNALLAGKLVLNNTTVSFAGASQLIQVRGPILVWRNTPNAVLGTVPTNLFNVSDTNIPGIITVYGVDLSALGSGKTIVAGMNALTPVTLVDCKLGASVTVSATPAGPGAAPVDLVRCDSGATNYRHERYRYEGTLTTETSITRVGGASDGTIPISHKLVTTANSKWVLPLEGFPIAGWNAKVNSSVSVTVFGTWNQGSVPNTDDIWVELEYPGSASSPLASFANSTKANNLAAGTPLSADGSVWNGGGSGAGWSPFAMSVTLNAPAPAMAGPIYATVRAARASSTFYIDPKVQVN